MSWHCLGPGLWRNGDSDEDAIYKVPSDGPVDVDDEVLAGRATKYIPEVKTAIEMYTEDGIVGHSTCMHCGCVVHRTDRFCWCCGAAFINYRR